MDEHISRHTGDEIDNAIDWVDKNAQEINQLQEEATAKWVLLNTLDNKVRALEQHLGIFREEEPEE